jgi:hypothetical protein
MITQSQIFRQIESLLANKISLGDFEDWLVRSSWNMHLDSGSEAQELVWKIELILAEHSSGHLDETELRAELKGLAPHLDDQTDWYASYEEANSVVTQCSATYLDCSLFQPILTLDYADKPTVEASE